MLQLLPKDCLEKILNHLLDKPYIKNWEDVKPFTSQEWSELNDPLHFSRSFHYNCSRIEFFNVNTILKIAKGCTEEGSLLPIGVKNYARNYLKNLDNIILDWNEKPVRDCKSRESDGFLLLTDAELLIYTKWKPSPYYVSLMLMNVCRNTRENINTNEYWNMRFANDYRKGKLYIRIPKDIKKNYIKKTKETILRRYTWTYACMSWYMNKSKKKILNEIENRNILLSLLKNQIDIDTYNNITDIEEVPRILSLEIPPAYLSNVNMNATNPYRITLQQVVLRIEKHQNNIDKIKLEHKKFKVIYEKIDNLFKSFDTHV